MGNLKWSILVIVFTFNTSIAQEWSSLKVYEKENNSQNLEKGNWLKKDRKKNTKRWAEANEYNLSLETGYEKYKDIKEIQAFYRWFEQDRKSKGHEMQWMGSAVIAAGQLAKLDDFWIQLLIVHNKELKAFANKGSKDVLKFAFPLLRKVRKSSSKITGTKALDWDKNFGWNEQCKIVEPIYKSLSAKSLKQLSRMAKGKGIYYFVIPKQIKYQGDISDCEARFKHGLNVLTLRTKK